MKYIIIEDTQTKEEYFFICEKWLCFERDEGVVFRRLNVCCDKEKTQIKYLLSKHTKSKLSDNHLWFSVFARPVQSNFNRTDRLTCILVLLNMTMLMNILYFGVNDLSREDALLTIGTIVITKSQVSLLYSF